jgi:hypothetical protein
MVIGHGDVDENAEAVRRTRPVPLDGRDVEDEYEDTRARMEQEVARHDRGDRSAPRRSAAPWVRRCLERMAARAPLTRKNAA